MNVVKGEIKMLGNATRKVLPNGNGPVTYSLIEFQDGNIVKNVQISGSLDNFLVTAQKVRATR